MSLREFKNVASRLLIVSPLVVSLFTANAYAAKCKTTIFSCSTTKGKKIEVCDSGKTIDYSFGKANKKPELSVKAPRDLASTFQWAGIGAENYAVDIPNGNTTTYSVFIGHENITEEHKIEAGVNVYVNKELISTVNCSTKKGIVNNMEGVKLKATE